MSIIIPALQLDRELRRCVDSVFVACAAKIHFETIIVAPHAAFRGSAERFGDARVIAETRRGIYSAMNDGVAASRGVFLYFLGQDDIVLPHFGDLVSTLSSAEAVSALIFDVYWGTQGVFFGHRSRWRILLRNICHQGIVYNRKVFDRHGPYLRAMKVQADHLVNVKMMWDGEMSGDIRYVPGAFVWYSDKGFSSRVAGDPVFRRLYPLVMRRHVGAWAAWCLIISRKVRGKL